MQTTPCFLLADGAQPLVLSDPIHFGCWSRPLSNPQHRGEDIIIRSPKAHEGGAIWQIVRDTGTLDLNSSYLYLLLARDFADTCVVAERDGKLLGFASGYRRPAEPSVIFLWQIGIAPEAQGQGLGKRLLGGFLTRPGARDAQWLETTIAPDNKASQALFTGMAKALALDCKTSPCFAAEDFPEPGHAAEVLYRIGPLTDSARQRLNP